jgi:hypothetical protein
MYLVTMSFRSYAKAPEIAEKFRSPASRRITMTAYFGVIVGSVLCTAGALVLLHPR